VKKTSIYLEPDLDRALQRRADAEGLTKAELIRRTLRGAVSERRRVKPRAVGVFDGPADLARNVDGHLARTGLGEP
jgi:predicted transcriptional regulator